MSELLEKLRLRIPLDAPLPRTAPDGAYAVELHKTGALVMRKVTMSAAQAVVSLAAYAKACRRDRTLSVVIHRNGREVAPGDLRLIAQGYMR